VITYKNEEQDFTAIKLTEVPRIFVEKVEK
jgi:hypothetical protein